MSEAAKRRRHVNTKASVAARVDRIDWARVEARIAADGYALLPGLVTEPEASGLRKMYAEDALFRRRIEMRNHGFGEGSYAYFDDPLPDLVAQLRQNLYRHLAPVSNRMMAALGRAIRYPASLDRFRTRCREAGQTRPTPLLLHYREGGYNRLHRDLYGDLAFPLQVAVNLSEPGTDYQGGEFMLVENLPRRQARGDVIPLGFREAIVFPVCDRPVPGKSRVLAAQMRHGVSRIKRGERYAMGIIFHDAT